MRQFMDIVTHHNLLEARKKKAPSDQGAPAATDTADRPKFDFMPDLEAGSRSVAKAPGAAGAPSRVLPGSRATGNQTRRAAAAAGAGMMAHPGAADSMRALMGHGMEDEISDADAAQNAGGHPDTAGEHPIPVNNDNLPAIVNKDIALAGEHRVVPNWHQVKHLPGYMLNAIRAGGRQVFRQFTNTPLEDIQMICTLPGMNDEIEVKAVMHWVRQNGVADDEAEMDFAGQKVKVRLWKTEDFSFLLVKDFMGVYIYSWTGGRGTKLAGNERKQLTHDQA